MLSFTFALFIILHDWQDTHGRWGVEFLQSLGMGYKNNKTDMRCLITFLQRHSVLKEVIWFDLEIRQGAFKKQSAKVCGKGQRA